MTKQTVWKIEHVLYWAERFNGFGYKFKGINSPYVWAGTNHYTSGMFVADHDFDEHAIDRRFGCAPIIEQLMLIDAENMPKKKKVELAYYSLITKAPLEKGQKITFYIDTYDKETGTYELILHVPFWRRFLGM
jgi:hypothetical protein